MSQTGRLFVPLIPECAVHGQMNYNLARKQYLCHGFDGEGCKHIVNDEDVPMKEIGTFDPDEFDFRYVTEWVPIE